MIISPARLVLGAAAVVAACAPAASASSAVPASTYATTAQATVVAAAGGWTAWSEPSDGAFVLVVRAPDGTVSRPAIAPRGVPFDVDLGVDAAGRVVAAFSRCAREPQRNGGANATAPNYATGARCRLRVLDLATGVERALGKAGGTTSEVLPSIAGAKVAFVAVRAHGKAELRVRDRTSSRSVVLDRGTWRTGNAGVAGGPAGVDTDGTTAAVIWRYQDPEFHDFNAILDVAPVSGRRASRQVAYGVNGEECSYDSILAPTVSAGAVTFLESTTGAWAAERARAGARKGATTYGPAVFGTTPEVLPTSAALDGTRLVVAQTATTPGHPDGATTVAAYTAGGFGTARPPISFCG